MPALGQASLAILQPDSLLQATDEFYSKLEGQKIDLKALQQVCPDPGWILGSWDAPRFPEASLALCTGYLMPFGFIYIYLFFCHLVFKRKNKP